MRRSGWRSGPAAMAIAALCAGAAAAQEAEPLDRAFWQIEGIAGWSAPSGLDGGGEVSVARAFAGVAMSAPVGGGTFIGLNAGGGSTDYSFSGGAVAPWGDLRDARVSIPVRFSFGESGTALVVPALRWNAESGADLADGRTEGLFAVAFWRLSDTLILGPGVGVFSELTDDTDVFGFLAVDWRFAPRWRLSTGQGVGATQGPGLNLSYAATDALSVGIAARIENVQFRLDDSGPAPGGIGQSRSLPLVATLDWRPRFGVVASLFAGIDTGGELTLRDSNGTRISESDIDPAAVFGGQIRLRF